MRIHWIIPTRVVPGSGGMRTIVQVATELADRGHEVTLSVSHEAYDPAEVQGVLDEGYGMRGVRVVAETDVPQGCELAVATEWRTAEPVRDLAAARKAYLVQDFEPWFMPMGYDQIRARLSYTYGFSAVCIGRWLPHKLADEAGMAAASFDFGIDAQTYRPLPDASREKAVCAIYQPAEKPRRCAPLLLEAMEIVHAVDPDVRLFYYGSGSPGETVPGYPGEVLGVLSKEDCNRLYNRCEVGICLSASNPSRIPFEMMAAGLPVIDMHVPNNLYDAVEGAELLVSPTPEDLAGAVLALLADDARRERMGRAGVDAMAGRAISGEAACAADLLERIARGEQLPEAREAAAYAAAPYRASDELQLAGRSIRKARLEREERRLREEAEAAAEAAAAEAAARESAESSRKGRLLGRLLNR